MWNDDATFGESEGGFNQAAKGTEYGSDAKENQRRAKVIAPVSIKQVLDCPETSLRIKNVEVHIVRVMGIVRAIETSSVKIMYKIEDLTGSMVAITYLENDVSSGTPVVENVYCTVTGSIRSQSEGKYILLFKITPVTSFNMIQDHYLTVMYLPLKAELLDNEIEVKAEKLDMMSTYGGSANLHDMKMDVLQKKLLVVLSGCNTESGMNATEINEALPVKTSIDKIQKALEFLMEEGHIFSTIDDFHFKATDCM